MGVALKVSLASLTLFIGVALLLTGCIISKNWWPMFVLIPVALLPPSLMLHPKDDFSENPGENVWANLSGFLTGFMILSIFAVSIILYHMGTIDGMHMALVTSGNFVCIFGTAAVYKSVGGESQEYLM
jgi:hypothetical protein